MKRRQVVQQRATHAPRAKREPRELSAAALEALPRREKICVHCGNSFIACPSVLTPSAQRKGRGRFCSLSCGRRFHGRQTIARECQVCGAGFSVAPYVVRRGGGKFCSQRCLGRAKWPKGAAHPSYKHGQSRQVPKPSVVTSAYQRVSNAVRSGRLQWQPCVRCGSIRRVQAHHDDYANPLQVTWLCEKCHKALHVERRAS